MFFYVINQQLLTTFNNIDQQKQIMIETTEILAKKHIIISQIMKLTFIKKDWFYVYKERKRAVK